MLRDAITSLLQWRKWTTTRRRKSRNAIRDARHLLNLLLLGIGDVYFYDGVGLEMGVLCGTRFGRLDTSIPFTIFFMSDLTRKEASKEHTCGDALIFSQASPYKTVGEFLANNSVAKAYTSTADNPAPIRITVKLVVRAVVRMTDQPASKEAIQLKFEVE
jgi:hypothetical protein